VYLLDGFQLLKDARRYSFDPEHKPHEIRNGIEYVF